MQSGTVKLNDNFRRRLQPDAISCGATCLRMMLDRVGLHQRLDLEGVKLAIGTNDVVGTVPDRTMLGLNILGAGGDFLIATNGEDALDGLIARQATVMFRTSLGGKHWVMLDPNQPDARNMVGIICPSRGPYALNRTDFMKSWKDRGYHAITLSHLAKDHMAIRKGFDFTSQDVEARLPRQIHEIPLRSFIGLSRVVIQDNQWTNLERRMVAEAATRIQNAAKDRWTRSIGYEHPELHFAATGGNGGLPVMMVTELRSGNVVAGIASGTRWVDEDHRGRGIGVELVLAAYSRPDLRFLAPSHYSVGGFASRVAAHRVALERAMSAQLNVPGNVLADYSRDLPLRLTDEAKAWVDFKLGAVPEPALEDSLPTP